MPLAPGTRLGPYEITAPLGAGGMGEVYRARDTRLGRDVAIKVLPATLSTHPEVRARFEREAKTVSSLNHPNICTLFDVGHEDGVDFLVMELIDGETLAARLQRGPLPAPELLKIGIEVADALDRAHRQGLVHRDLKPGNVMLTRSGAKLLDFGLARVTGLSASNSDALHLADRDARAHHRRQHRRHVPVHVARGAGGPRGRRARRHLGAGRDAVRNGHRTTRVRRQEPGVS